MKWLIISVSIRRARILEYLKHQRFFANLRWVNTIDVCDSDILSNMFVLMTHQLDTLGGDVVVKSLLCLCDCVIYESSAGKYRQGIEVLPMAEFLIMQSPRT